MPDDLRDFPLVLVVLSVIAGMVGGCGAASFQVLTGRQLTTAIMMAYGTLGAALGAASMLVILIMAPQLGVAHTLLIAGVLGAGSTFTVAVVRYGVRIFLKARGIEVEVRFRGKDGKGCDE